MTGLHEPESGLKYSQQNIFITSLRHIDRLLSEIEAILECGSSKCVFPRFRLDLDEIGRREMHTGLDELRQKLIDSMKRMGVTTPVPETAASHAIETNLDFVDIDIEELRPRYMKAYGKLATETASNLNGVLDDLQQEARRFRRLLHDRGTLR